MLTSVSIANNLINIQTEKSRVRKSLRRNNLISAVKMHGMFIVGGSWEMEFVREVKTDTSREMQLCKTFSFFLHLVV